MLSYTLLIGLFSFHHYFFQQKIVKFVLSKTFSAQFQFVLVHKT